MRPSRQFRPMAPAALLEDRIAPSTAGAPHAAARTGSAQVATFPLDIADTVASGQPVYEQITTRFGPGDVQTETDSINPDNADQTIDTLKTIVLPKNGGTETVTDFSYVALTGNTVHVITTNLPDGTTQIQNETFQVEGNTTLIQGTVTLPNGNINSISGSTTVHGSVSTTDLTTQTAAGATVQDHTVVISHGELHQTSTTTETGNGRPSVTHSTTTITRLQPPSSTALGNQLPGATISAPTIVGNNNSSSSG